MLHSTSLLHHNHRFLFSFTAKASHSDSHSHSQPQQQQQQQQTLSFAKSLSLPLSSPASSCCRVARVSTEALELSSPAPGFNFSREIARLSVLRDELAGCATLDDKLRVIDADSRVRKFFGSSSSRRRNSGLARVLSELRLDSDDLFLLKCLVAAGQEHVLCLGETGPAPLESPAAPSGSVKSAFYALAEMIENLDSYNGNSRAGAEPPPLKVVQVCSVAPLHGTTTTPPSSPTTPTSLPLTFFDLLWLRFPPVERLFFYEFQHSPSSFYDSVLPSLKHSLSLTLQHFLPFSGNIIWPLGHDSLVPTITYVPGHDAVQFTVAESNSNFTNLISDLCEASKRHHLIPHLATSHEKASVMAIQVTLFPNSGFCIGIATHHAALDGKSSTSFMKSWAYTCSNIKKDGPMHEALGRVDVCGLTPANGKAVSRFESVTPNTCSNNSNNKHGDDDQSQSPTCLLSLPQHLTPFFDRSVIRDPKGISQVFVDALLKHGGPNKRNLKVWEHITKVKNDAIKGLFEFTPLHIQKLKQYAQAKMNKGKVQLSIISTFSVTCAYVLACLVKAEQPKAGIVFIFSVDCRSRLDPPIVPNYVGNCIAGQTFVAETKDLIGEDGFINALEGINEALDRVKDDGVLNGAENWMSNMLNVSVTENKIYSTAGSPRFEVYGVDFGWGRPKKVDITSIDKTGAFSLSESRNDNGGIEIGLVLNKQEMEAFSALFVQGLESL